MGKMTGSAASEMAAKSGSGMAAKIGGETFGQVIGIAVIAWDVIDHFFTKQTELPILRRNIADYFGQMKNRLLHDPESGILHCPRHDGEHHRLVIANQGVRTPVIPSPDF